MRISDTLARIEAIDGEWRYERIEGGHWIPLEKPERLNELLLAWFASGAPP